jgi:DnaJ-domain-containing protein 1
MPWNLLDLVRIPHWLAKTGFLCSPLLPLACGASFLSRLGSEAHDGERLKAAIRSKATDAIAAMTRAGEIDGLDAGIAALYRQFDLWWAGEYRASINRWIELHTIEAIYDPEAAAAFVKGLTEQARADMNRMAEALESFCALECRRYALEALIRTAEESQGGLAERAVRSMDELRTLVIAKHWDEFRGRAAEIAQELDGEIAEYRLRSQSTVTLPAGTDPYRVLGAQISAPTSTIRKLRLRLAQVYHPDIGGDTGNDMKMAELNAAYDAVMRERTAQAR